MHRCLRPWSTLGGLEQCGHGGNDYKVLLLNCRGRLMLVPESTRRRSPVQTTTPSAGARCLWGGCPLKRILAHRIERPLWPIGDPRLKG